MLLDSLTYIVSLTHANSTNVLWSDLQLFPPSSQELENVPKKYATRTQPIVQARPIFVLDFLAPLTTGR